MIPHFEKTKEQERIFSHKGNLSRHITAEDDKTVICECAGMAKNIEHCRQQIEKIRYTSMRQWRKNDPKIADLIKLRKRCNKIGLKKILGEPCEGVKKMGTPIDELHLEKIFSSFERMFVRILNILENSRAYETDTEEGMLALHKSELEWIKSSTTKNPSTKGLGKIGLALIEKYLHSKGLITRRPFAKLHSKTKVEALKKAIKEPVSR